MLATFFKYNNQNDSYDLFLLTIISLGKLAKHCQMLKSALSTKFSTTKVLNLNLFSYLCVQYLAILKEKSQSFFNLTSGYNIGR